MVEYYGKRVKISSWIFIVLGAFSLIQCIGLGFNARHVTAMVMSGAKDGNYWGNKDAPKPKLSNPITSDEFIVYDTFKNFAASGAIFSIILLCIGLKGKWAEKMQSPAFAKKVFKCNIFKIFLLICVSMWMHCLGKDMREVLHN